MTSAQARINATAIRVITVLTEGAARLEPSQRRASRNAQLLAAGRRPAAPLLLVRRGRGATRCRRLLRRRRLQFPELADSVARRAELARSSLTTTCVPVCRSIHGQEWAMRRVSVEVALVVRGARSMKL